MVTKLCMISGISFSTQANHNFIRARPGTVSICGLRRAAKRQPQKRQRAGIGGFIAALVWGCLERVERAARFVLEGLGGRGREPPRPKMRQHLQLLKGLQAGSLLTIILNAFSASVATLCAQSWNDL